jgi:RNA polymerase sigma-70 factor, ECF subfamily
MSTAQKHDLTLLLTQWAKGDQHALDELTPLVYKELRQLAASQLRRERKSHTLQPTALVNEAYLRLVDQKKPNWQSRSHFFGVSARLMRQILVDHARRRRAGKRVVLRVSLSDAEGVGLERKCKAVELRYFCGLSHDEIAQVLNVSPITVRRDLRMAEAWLHNEVQNT